jgi:hypothetical protein
MSEGQQQETRPDLIQALLFSWTDEQVASFGHNVLPRLLDEEIVTMRPNECLTSFDTVPLPAQYIRPDWVGVKPIKHWLDQYCAMSKDEMARDEGCIMGVRCIALLLFAFDTRMRRLVFGDHGIHGRILCTRRMDENKVLETRGVLFMHELNRSLRTFVPDLQAGANDPEAQRRMVAGTIEYARCRWSNKIPM